MKGNIKSMIAGLIIGVTISGLTAFALTDEVQKTLNYNDIKIKLNGEELIPVDANGDYVEQHTFPLERLLLRWGWGLNGILKLQL